MTQFSDERYATDTDGNATGEIVGAAERRARREFLRNAAAGTIAVPALLGLPEMGWGKEKHKSKAEAAPKKGTGAGAGTGATSRAGHAHTHADSRNRAGSSSTHAGSVDSHLAHQQNRMAQAARGEATATEMARSSLGHPLPSLYHGWNQRNFTDIQSDEKAHVAFLMQALGSMARPSPTFQGLEQPNVHSFATVSRTLENTGVAAYLGAVPILASTTAGQQFIAPAASIALIEARHAGYLNTLLNLVPTLSITGQVVTLEAPLSATQVASMVAPFVVSLNGGPPLIPPGGLSNPVDVLNFALALEYLELEFYNTNVPKFAHLLAH